MYLSVLEFQQWKCVDLVVIQACENEEIEEEILVVENFSGHLPNSPSKALPNILDFNDKYSNSIMWSYTAVSFSKGVLNLILNHDNQIIV